jgi:hypothetical protein
LIIPPAKKIVKKKSDPLTGFDEKIKMELVVRSQNLGATLKRCICGHRITRPERVLSPKCR